MERQNKARLASTVIMTVIYTISCIIMTISVAFKTDYKISSRLITITLLFALGIYLMYHSKIASILTNTLVAGLIMSMCFIFKGTDENYLEFSVTGMCEAVYITYILMLVSVMVYVIMPNAKYKTLTSAIIATVGILTAVAIFLNTNSLTHIIFGAVFIYHNIVSMHIIGEEQKIVGSPYKLVRDAISFGMYGLLLILALITISVVTEDGSLLEILEIGGTDSSGESNKLKNIE